MRVSFLEDYTGEDSSTSNSWNDENIAVSNQDSRPRNNDSVLGSLDNLLDPSPLTTTWGRNRFRNVKKLQVQANDSTPSSDKGKGRKLSVESSTLSSDKSSSLGDLRRAVQDNLYRDAQKSGVNRLSHPTSIRTPFYSSNPLKSTRIEYPIQSTPHYNPSTSIRPLAPFSSSIPSTSSATHDSFPSTIPRENFFSSINTTTSASPQSSTERKVPLPSTAKPQFFFRPSRQNLPPSPSTSPEYSPSLPNPVLRFSSRTPLVHVSSSVIKKSRLSTKGLPLIRHSLRNSGTIEIVKGSGDLVIDINKRSSSINLIRIDQDGENISITSRSGTNTEEGIELYKRDSLPLYLEKYYLLALKFIQAVRGKVKKVILFDQNSTLTTKQTIYSDQPPSFEITFYSTSLVDSIPQLKIRISRTSNLIQIYRLSSPPSDKILSPETIFFPLDTYLESNKFSTNNSTTTSLTGNELTKLDYSISQINSVDLIIRELETLPSSSTEELVKLEKEIRTSSVPIQNPTNPTEALLLLLFQGSNNLDASEANEDMVKAIEKEQHRYLNGAGWILLTSSSITGKSYQILMADGLELEIRESEKVIKWNENWYSLITWLGLESGGKGRGRRKLSMRVRRRLGIVGEMIGLF